jgi:hypothetical protein
MAFLGTEAVVDHHEEYEDPWKQMDNYPGCAGFDHGTGIGQQI